MKKLRINPDAIKINTPGLISEVANETSIPREICKRVTEQFIEQMKINLVKGKMVMLDKFVTIRIQKRFFAKNARIFTSDERNFFIRIYVKSSTYFSHFVRLFIKDDTLLPMRCLNQDMKNLAHTSDATKKRMWGDKNIKELKKRKKPKEICPKT